MDKLVLILFFLIQSLQASLINAQTIERVGSGCARASIQAAIDANSGSTDFLVIKVRAGSYNAQAIQVPQKTITIEGGYANCTELSPSGAATILQGTGFVPTIDLPDCLPVGVCNTDTQRGFNLINITVENGKPALRIQRSSQTQLDRVVLRNSVNTAGVPGAGLVIDPIALLSGAFPSVVVFLLDNTLILNNSSTSSGGGVGCRNATLFVDQVVAISNNTAAGDGGGVYVGAGCTFVDKAGGFLVGINNNSTEQSGGGVYVAAGGSATFDVDTSVVGVRTLPLVSGNSAERGGAALASGGGNIQIDAGQFNNNTVTGDDFLGGAIQFVANESTPSSQGNLIILPGGENQIICPRLGCVQIIGNTANLIATASFDRHCSAIYARSPNRIEITASTIANNVMNAMDPMDMGIISANVCLEANRLSSIATRQILSFYRNLVSDNSGTPVGVYIGESGGSGTIGPNVTFAHNTVAGNTYVPGNGVPTNFSTISGADALFTLQNNLIMDSSAIWFIDVPTARPTVFDNNFGLTGASIVGTVAPTGTQTWTQTFADAIGGDYSLLNVSTNLAVDGALLPAIRDIDIQWQGVFDLPNIPNFPGPADLGADEINPILFKNGFE